MRVALLSTPTRTKVPNTVPPLGIMYLASSLRNAGHQVLIIDIAKLRLSNQDTVKEIIEFQADLVAISGIITAYRFIYHLVKELRDKLPEVPIVAGGHVALENVDLILKSVQCHYVISGYGERKIVKLTEYLSGKCNISDIPGLSYIDHDVVRTNPGDLFFTDIDEIPLPAYDLIDMEYYITSEKADPALEEYLNSTGKTPPPMRRAFIIAARGCTDRCSFCVHEFEHKGFHVHSTEYLVKSIRVLYEDYGVRVFHFGEDLFIFNVAQAERFATMMNTHFPDAYFSCSTRADYVNPEMLQILQQSNCYTLLYGFESGDPTILRILGKRMTPETNINAFRLIKQTKIIPACSFMIGSPGETQKTIANTIQAINDAGLEEGGVFYTTPYPGSRLFRWCLEQKKIKDVEKYLMAISDRDASIMSFNFTPYPDIIVKMMYVLIQNCFYKNKKKHGIKADIGLRDRMLKHMILPCTYSSYFFIRKMLSGLNPRYREDTIFFELNSRGTLKISTDRK